VGRKKKHEEHENLERWLVSYADFITLLFATFVCLYGIAVADVTDFAKLEEALKNAFSTNTILDGSPSFFSSQQSIMQGGSQAGEVNPIMLEYLSQKYEETSFEDIKKEVDKLKEDGFEAEINDKGLVLKIDDTALKFASNSAEISQEAAKVLMNVGALITSKFQIHVIRVEGHTDSIPSSGPLYPTNWELSGARAASVVNFFIKNVGIMPQLLIAAGYADTVPIAKNDTPENRAKNRRVEIVILKNKLGRMEGKDIKGVLDELSKSPSRPKAMFTLPKENKQPAETENVIPGHNLKENSMREKLYTPDYSGDLYIKESARIEDMIKKDIEKNIGRPSFMEEK